MTPLYGVTHDASTGAEIMRQVRVMKVGFGIPKGADVHVWIDTQGKWCVQGGLARKESLPKEVLENRQKAELRYVELRRDFQKYASDSRNTIRPFPRKIPYFTFHRLGIDGEYVPDFDAIEMHGPVPTEVDIVFLTDDPFDAAYHWFTQTRLCCHGDGKNAKRHITAAQAGDEEAVKEAQARNEEWFPVTRCAVADCPASIATVKGTKEVPPQCKPHGRLHFQLVNQPRFGGVVTYDTTGYRSITQLFSCIQQIKTITGRGDAARGFIAGIQPLKLVLRPYRLVHNGISGVQFGVSLEYRADNAVTLSRTLIEQAQQFRAALEVPRRAIAAAAEPLEAEVVEVDDFGADPAAMRDGFFADDEPDYDTEDPAPADDENQAAAEQKPEAK